VQSGLEALSAFALDASDLALQLGDTLQAMFHLGDG
jgi:hypothetical protein